MDWQFLSCHVQKTEFLETASRVGGSGDGPAGQPDYLIAIGAKWPSQYPPPARKRQEVWRRHSLQVPR